MTGWSSGDYDEFKSKSDKQREWESKPLPYRMLIDTLGAGLVAASELVNAPGAVSDGIGGASEAAENALAKTVSPEKLVSALGNTARNAEKDYEDTTKARAQFKWANSMVGGADPLPDDCKISDDVQAWHDAKVRVSENRHEYAEMLAHGKLDDRRERYYLYADELEARAKADKQIQELRKEGKTQEADSLAHQEQEIRHVPLEQAPLKRVDINQATSGSRSALDDVLNDHPEMIQALRGGQNHSDHSAAENVSASTASAPEQHGAESKIQK